MRPYKPKETLDRLINQHKKEQEFARSLGNTIPDAMMVLKGITLLEKIDTFNEEIWECH